MSSPIGGNLNIVFKPRFSLSCYRYTICRIQIPYSCLRGGISHQHIFLVVVVLQGFPTRVDFSTIAVVYVSCFHELPREQSGLFLYVIVELHGLLIRVFEAPPLMKGDMQKDGTLESNIPNLKLTPQVQTLTLSQTELVSSSNEKSPNVDNVFPVPENNDIPPLISTVKSRPLSSTVRRLFRLLFMASQWSPLIYLEHVLILLEDVLARLGEPERVELYKVWHTSTGLEESNEMNHIFMFHNFTIVSFLRILAFKSAFILYIIVK